MKILFVHPAIRSYRASLFRMLGELGVEFLFTTVNDPATPAGKETGGLLRDFGYPYTQARELRRLPVTNMSVDLYRVFRYDLVIFSCLTSAPFLLCAPVLKLLGRRVILFDETWRYQHAVSRYRILLPYVRFLLSRCVGAFVAASAQTRAMFVDDFGVPERMVFIALNNTVDLACVPPDTARQSRIGERVGNAARGRATILFLARIVQIKALDVLIRALSLCDYDSCLIVVGDGPCRSECEALAASLDLDDRVSFQGACDSEDARYYFGCADIYVLPSRFMPLEAVNAESWGFALNEAMSLETPVITTTAVGAAVDLILDGETGMLARENDPASLAEKIDFLLADDDRRRRIGRQGRSWLLERCSDKQNLAAWGSAMSLALPGSAPAISRDQ